jgi:uncharacterized protein YraI
MKSIKIIIASAASALLLLGIVGLPAGAASSASALSSPLPAGVCIARATVNIRSGPSTRNRIVGRVPRNGAFTVTKKGTWLQGTSRWGNGWVLASLMRCK